MKERTRKARAKRKADCEAKKRFGSSLAASKFASGIEAHDAGLTGKYPYRCQVCGGWHLSANPGILRPADRNALVRLRAELGRELRQQTGPAYTVIDTTDTMEGSE